MVAKHTPGPWKAVEDAQGICGLMHPKKKGVAVAWFSSCHSPVNGYVGEQKPKVGFPERQANARLIAAAPELLAALIDLREAIRHTPIPVESFDLLPVDEADQAIRKAKGDV